MHEMLEGVRVVELASWTFVPAAGAVLADWGADVIKIESLEGGDPQRGLVSSGVVAGGGGVNHFVEQPNRGKRSFGLDISNPEGVEVLYKLIETADIFISNLRPGSLQRAGLDVDSVRARNANIIYARGHALGVRGEGADASGYDLATYWARGGIGEALSSGDGEYPPLQRPAFGDVFGGFSIAGGIAAALYRRQTTGQPSVVDVSLLATAMWQLSPDIVGSKVIGGEIPKFELRDIPNPVANIYRTSDNRFIAFVLLQSDRFWSDFCTRIGRADMIDDERFADAAARAENRRECNAQLRETFGAQPLEYWEKQLAGFEGVWSPFRTALETHDDPQAIANGYLPQVTDGNGNTYALVANPVQFNETPPQLGPAPGHGQHTEELLLELGYDWDRIIALKEASAVL